ncbi:predicted protein [Sclerotinia sclerotiorum 1980 UF-70]|uniref:Uncharacterized protein n=1 Tax=Sclerotinia sclerotiorum (strain ATCC 18683 / 1980 / Ss-1) TaxID=665079 RepID=A7EQ23_SCLS1|nr:predicted protein [Sclerotinia sclerotiorum 1980 UF-70]EDO04939.1 predicted protein [Sclerotinia sclerotiorum 1980 UF-70]
MAVLSTPREAVQFFAMEKSNTLGTHVGYFSVGNFRAHEMRIDGGVSLVWPSMGAVATPRLHFVLI